MERQSAARHETPTRVQPLISDFVENAQATGRATGLWAVPSLSNTMSQNGHHLLRTLLAPEAILYFDERNKATRRLISDISFPEISSGAELVLT